MVGQLWGLHFSTYKISFLSRCISPTAKDMSLLIKVTLTWSNGKWRPPNNKTFYCLSEVWIKWDIQVSSEGLKFITLWITNDKRKFNLNLWAVRKKIVDIFNIFCTNKLKCIISIRSPGNAVTRTKIPRKSICTWR